MKEILIIKLSVAFFFLILRILETTLERINGGDAKFIQLKNPLPEFNIRK